MGRFIIMLFVVILFTFLQSVLLAVIPMGSWHTLPDLPLIMMVFFSIEFGRSVAQSAGWFSGLVVDLVAGAPLGFYALLQLCLGAGFGTLRERFRIQSIMVAMTIISVATVLKQGLLVMLTRVFNLYDLPLAQVSVLSQHVFLVVLLNAAMAVPVFFFMRWAMPRLSTLIRMERRR